MEGLGKLRGNLFPLLPVSLSVIICDQLSKHLFNQYLSVGQSLPVIRNIFHFTLVYNTGIAFGLFKNQSVLFIILSLAVISSLFINILRESKDRKLDRINWFSLSLILGGAVGNLIDRLRFGYVVDFLDFRIWPVFNLADSCITVGVILIFIQCIQSSVPSGR